MASPIMDAACMTYEGISFQLEAFPRTKEPVWVLGRIYNIQPGNTAFYWSLQFKKANIDNEMSAELSCITCYYDSWFKHILGTDI